MFNEILGEEKKKVYKDLDAPVTSNRRAPNFGDIWKRNQKAIDNAMDPDDEYEYEDLQLDGFE